MTVRKGIDQPGGDFGADDRRDRNIEGVLQDCDVKACVMHQLGDGIVCQERFKIRAVIAPAAHGDRFDLHKMGFAIAG